MHSTRDLRLITASLFYANATLLADDMSGDINFYMQGDIEIRSTANYCFVSQSRVVAHLMWRRNYTVFQKKLDHQTHGGNIVKS